MLGSQPPPHPQHLVAPALPARGGERGGVVPSLHPVGPRRGDALHRRRDQPRWRPRSAGVPEGRQRPVEAMDVLAQRVRDRHVRPQPLKHLLGQICQGRAAVEQQRVTDQTRGSHSDLRGPLAPAVQHRRDLLDRSVDRSPAEHLPRDRAAADVAQHVQLGEPEQVGQGDRVGPRRRVGPSRIGC
jgi:hypothetical protein